ncbi:MAG: hypothetical protein KOO63_14200, partial [Bacteroidales bacterium]|nr:hypothetical protein [Candidatus Latescibacterota bacterium]
MRRSAIIGSLMAIALLFVSEPAGAGIGARVYGGFSHISYSDYNDWVDQANEEIGIGEKLDNIKWVPEFGGELFYPVSPMIEIGLGAGLMSGSSEYFVSGGSSTINFNSKIKAVPITANLYFRPSVPFTSMSPYLYG